VNDANRIYCEKNANPAFRGPVFVDHRIMRKLDLKARSPYVLIVAKISVGISSMTWQQRITIDPEILVGKPVIKGTRLSVEFIVGLLAEGWSEQEILDNYPGLTSEDINACLAYRKAMFESSRGCVMPAKSIEEIDADIRQMRVE
jgi:uncharacterized protein (DUF433 family)